MTDEQLYARLGTIIGHEISHSFDARGSQFDKDGNMSNWWTDEDYAEFEKRVDKLNEYLNGIVAFDDQHFIGESIDGEVAADITAVECMLYMASQKEDFDYDEFFTSLSGTFRSLTTYSSELNQLTQDAHPLDYARTNIVLQQFQEFYDTYNVQPGDNMYLAPEDRCIIW